MLRNFSKADWRRPEEDQAMVRYWLEEVFVTAPKARPNDDDMMKAIVVGCKGGCHSTKT